MAIKTVRVYHDAIMRLAEERGVQVFMDELAEEVAQQALDNARVIIPGLGQDFLTVEGGKDTKGLFFRVEMTTHATGDNTFSKYLTTKEAKEHNWFEPAVQAVVGRFGIRTASVRGARNFLRTFM